MNVMEPVALKSIVSSHVIKASQIFSAGSITSKRLGTAVSPMRRDKVIGRKAPHDSSFDDMIHL